MTFPPSLAFRSLVRFSFHPVHPEAIPLAYVQQQSLSFLNGWMEGWTRVSRRTSDGTGNYVECVIAILPVLLLLCKFLKIMFSLSYHTPLSSSLLVYYHGIIICLPREPLPVVHIRLQTHLVTCSVFPFLMGSTDITTDRLHKPRIEVKKQ